MITAIQRWEGFDWFLFVIFLVSAISLSFMVFGRLSQDVQYYIFDTEGKRYSISQSVFDAYKDLPRK